MSSAVIIDYQRRAVRLTAERWAHILSHAEMVDQRERLIETLSEPGMVTTTVLNEDVLAYHRLYETTPVTRKYLVVIVKTAPEDAFVLTAYYSSRPKKGRIVWQR